MSASAIVRESLLKEFLSHHSAQRGTKVVDYRVSSFDNIFSSAPSLELIEKPLNQRSPRTKTRSSLSWTAV